MAADLLAALIGATFAGSAAILLALIARRLVRRLFGSVAAYAFWLVVPAAVAASLLPARAPDALPLQPAPLRPMAETAVHAAADWVAAQAPAGAARAASFDWAALVVGVWIAGALLCAGLLFGVQRRTVRRFGELIEDRTGGLPVLRAATNDAGPAVIGGLMPRLVVPYDFESRFSADEQRLILAHERAHIAFRDPKVNWLIALLRCLNWFNPLVHLGAVMARVDQELACDAAVVGEHPGERRSYAEALLKSQLAPASLPLGCYWPVRSTRLLKERLEMLAIEKPGRARRLTGAAAIAAAGLAAAYAAWAAEPQQQIAALAPRPAVTAATPAPKPTTTAVSYVLPPPTAAQYAALAADNPMKLRWIETSPNGAPLPVHEQPGGVDSATGLLYGFHVQDVASGPRRSIIPRGYFVDDVVSLWLADGETVPSMEIELPTGVVSGLHRPGKPIDGTIKYRVQGDQVTVDAVIIHRGKAIAVHDLKTTLGETAVAQIEGGHIISVSPRLREMPPGFLAGFEEDETEEDLAEGERHLRRLLAR